LTPFKGAALARPKGGDNGRHTRLACFYRRRTGFLGFYLCLFIVADTLAVPVARVNAKSLTAQVMTTNQAAVLREVVVTLKEENAVLKRWLKDKSLSEEVMQVVEISLTKISVALGKVLELGYRLRGNHDSIFS
jgi:hypothetical protein